jgi:hypothetical protein
MSMRHERAAAPAGRARARAGQAFFRFLLMKKTKTRLLDAHFAQKYSPAAHDSLYC